MAGCWDFSGNPNEGGTLSLREPVLGRMLTDARKARAHTSVYREYARWRPKEVYVGRVAAVDKVSSKYPRSSFFCHDNPKFTSPF